MASVPEPSRPINPYNTIVPLIDIWHTYLMPYLVAGHDLTMARVRVRRVSRCHYEWDEAFCPPEKWLKAYTLSGRIECVARLLKCLSFLGWDSLPPMWYDIKIHLPLEDSGATFPQARLEVTSKYLKLTVPGAPPHGNFGTRSFDDFHLKIQCGSGWGIDHMGIVVHAKEPDRREPECFRIESVDFEQYGERAATDLRRFLQAMPVIFRQTGTCSLADLDAALMLAYQRELPRIEVPIFRDDDDDEHDDASWSDDGMEQHNVRWSSDDGNSQGEEDDEELSLELIT